MKYYLVIIWGDVEPELRPAVDTYDEVVAQAKQLRAESDDNGVYWLRIDEKVTMGSFSGGEIEPEWDELYEIDDEPITLTAGWFIPAAYEAGKAAGEKAIIIPKDDNG